MVKPHWFKLSAWENILISFMKSVKRSAAEKSLIYLKNYSERLHRCRSYDMQGNTNKGLVLEVIQLMKLFQMKSCMIKMTM